MLSVGHSEHVSAAVRVKRNLLEYGNGGINDEHRRDRVLYTTGSQ